MVNPVSYHQRCPVCGRTLLIQVRLLGSRVYCQHCGGGFLATDSACAHADHDAVERPLESVVDDLLARAALRIEQAAAAPGNVSSVGAGGCG
ncbi:MAG: response regulator [Planctomycetia bacterium]|nr:response regulator [Planctomycetia bacterium]